MALENANYISELVETNPTSSDLKSQGDNHLRTIKKALKQTISGFAGAALVTANDIGSGLVHVLNPTTALLSYAPMLCLLYVPLNTNSLGVVGVNVSGLGAVSIKTLYGDDPTAGDIVAGVPVILMFNGTYFINLAGSGFLSKTGNQTLNGNFLITGSAQINSGLTIGGNTSLTGGALVPTMLIGDVSSNAASTEFTAIAVEIEKLRAEYAESFLAPLHSPALSGTPTAPTAPTGDNSGLIANTQFVTTAIANEAVRATVADSVIAANVGSMLGINFGSFFILDGELNVTHLTTSEPSLVDGDLILTYETL